MHRVGAVAQAYRQLRRQSEAMRPATGRIRWMLEELWVSYFAQELRTPYPVSDQQIYQAMKELAG